MIRPAIHPGEVLADELAELGIIPTELCARYRFAPWSLIPLSASSAA